MELPAYALGLVATGTVLTAVIRGVNQIVFGGPPRPGAPGWRGVYYRLLFAVPIVLGGLLGLAPLPSPLPSLTGTVLWYALGGALAPVIYNAAKAQIKHRAAR